MLIQVKCGMELQYFDVDAKDIDDARRVAFRVANRRPVNDYQELMHATIHLRVRPISRYLADELLVQK